MKAEYKRDLKSNYLVLEAKEEKTDEDYTVRMVEQNQIPGLLLFHRSRMDGRLYFNYEITGKQSICSLFEKRYLGYSDIVFLLTGIGEYLDTFQKYLLDPEKLLFDPQFLFTEPDFRKIWFCYAPGMEHEAPVLLLAEFILKRLNHQDGKAVALGYRFYGKVQEENFSLFMGLKELMADGCAGMEERAEGQDVYRQEREYFSQSDAGNAGQMQPARQQQTAAGNVGKMRMNKYRQAEAESVEGKWCAESANRPRDAYADQEPEVIHRMREGEAVEKKRYFAEKEGSKKNGGSTSRQSGKEKSRDKTEGIAGRIFRIIHPAVLLSTLFLLAAVEAVFYFGYLRLTEAGGAFFLILSVELLANSSWQKAKERKEKERFEGWTREYKEDEEIEEEYRKLQEELYFRAPQKPRVDNKLEETRCLTDLPEGGGLCLIYVPVRGEQSGGKEIFPDIFVGNHAVTVGKMKEQCEALLNAETVSRMHARLEYRDQMGYLKDLNSRNGTFLNGDRLKPQELRKFTEGDRIAFADIQYRVVRSSDSAG